MAQVVTLEGLRSQILTSIFGRRFGLDSGNYAVGFKGTRSPVQSVTSATTGTTVDFGGTALVSIATAASTFALAAPVPGAEMAIVNSSTGVGAFLTLASGNFVTTAGSTTTQVKVGGQGASVIIRGISTALALVLGNYPQVPTSAASTSFAPASSFV